ncbi:MAG: polysaccharide export protein [Verrucomicrobia bacterium]|nr:polysaccharide export protein [Verrucomicrobiota bacterium]
MKSRTLFGVIFCTLVVALLTLAPLARADVTLRPGDSFDVRIGGVPSDEMTTVNGTYTIDGEGNLNMPYIGKISVNGMTQSQISSVIERTYRSREIYTNPTITLVIAATGRFVNVGGAVKNPQRVPYTPDMTVLSAINAAGDFNEFANQAKVQLLRDGKVIVVNCKELRRDPSKDPGVRPGDQIQVPERWF